MLYETLTELATRIPIIRTGARKFIQVFALQVTGLVPGDVVALTGSVSTTNPYTYNVMVGCTIRRTRQIDVWMSGAVEIARPHVLNITPAMHHYPFGVTRFDRITDGGDWWYHFVAYAEASGATSGAKMIVDPYGCLQAVVLRP